MPFGNHKCSFGCNQIHGASGAAHELQNILKFSSSGSVGGAGTEPVVEAWVQFQPVAL